MKAANQNRRRGLWLIATIALCVGSSAQLAFAEEPADQNAKSSASPAAPQKKKPIDWSLIEGNRSESSAHSSVFGLEAQGTKFIYVFDRSASMGDNRGKPLRAAKAELLASLNELDDRQQFYIIFYNEEPRLFNAGPTHTGLVFATPENKRAAADFVAGITADDGTNHLNALLAAIRLRPT